MIRSRWSPGWRGSASSKASDLAIFFRSTLLERNCSRSLIKSLVGVSCGIGHLLPQPVGHLLDTALPSFAKFGQPLIGQTNRRVYRNRRKRKIASFKDCQVKESAGFQPEIFAHGGRQADAAPFINAYQHGEPPNELYRLIIQYAFYDNLSIC